MVVFKWVVTYTACPLGKLTRIGSFSSVALTAEHLTFAF